MSRITPQTAAMILTGLTPLVALFAFRGTVVVVSLVALAGLWSLARRQWRMPAMTACLGLLAALLAWSALSGLWAHTPGLAVPKALSLAALVGAGILAVGSFGSWPDGTRGRLLTVLVGALAGVALLAAADHALGMPLSRFVHGRLPPGAMLVPPKAAATLFSIWAVLAAGACWSRGWRWRAVAAVLAALVLVRVTSSNAGLLGLGGGLAVLFCARFGPRIVRFLMILTVAGGFALGPLASAIPDTAIIADKVRWIPPSGLHRLAIWTFTGEKIMERPLLGWGMDGSRALPGGEDDVLVTLHVDDDPTYCKPSMCVQWLQKLPLHPHNFILQIWVELGVVGAALFALLVATLITATARLPTPQGATALAAITASLAVASTGYGIWQAWWLAALWLTAALGVCVLRPEDRGEAGRLAAAPPV